MKTKIAMVFLASTLIVGIDSFTQSGFAASELQSEVVGAKAITDRVEVREENGFTVTVTTTLIQEDIQTYMKKLEQKGTHIIKPHTSNNTKGNLTNFVMPEYLQNDYFEGSGNAYSSAAGGNGYIYCRNGFVGLNVFGGHVDAYLTASSVGGLKAKNRMVLTTYGAVGGSWGAIKEYVFQNTNYSVAGGNPSLTVNSDLSGAIAGYSVSVYGDFTNDYNQDFTVAATLVNK